MRQLSRLRTLAVKEGADKIHVKETNRNAILTAAASANANSYNNPSNSSKPRISSTHHSVVYEPDVTGDVRGCIEAISACLAAIAAAHATDRQGPTQAADNAAADLAFPPLLQASKGAGTTECRDSARELLGWFGHSPMLHVEGVVWMKTSGKRGDLPNMTRLRSEHSIETRHRPIVFLSRADISSFMPSITSCVFISLHLLHHPRCAREHSAAQIITS